MAFTRLRNLRSRAGSEPAAVRRGFGKSAAAVATLTAAAVVLSACGGYSDEVHASGEFADMVKPAISVTDDGGKPLDKDAVGVQPGLPIVVNATEGALRVLTACWVRLYGLVCMEVFRSMPFTVGDLEPLFEAELCDVLTSIGVRYRAPHS